MEQKQIIITIEHNPKWGEFDSGELRADIIYQFKKITGYEPTNISIE